MTRWNDISDEDKRDFAWIEVTGPTYIKGARRQPGKPARRWEYQTFYAANWRKAERMRELGEDGWEVISLRNGTTWLTNCQRWGIYLEDVGWERAPQECNSMVGFWEFECKREVLT